METKGIDLTKCNNCRYKARIDGNEDYGRICVENGGLAFLRSDNEDGYIAAWHTDIPVIEGMSGRKATDFEIVPRDPETYKDWQVGDRCYQPDEDDYIGIMEVIFRSGELVVLKDVDDEVLCLTVAKMEQGGIVLELTDIERQIIEEKKTEWKPQDGDICYVKGAHGVEWVFIKNGREYKTASYIRMVLDLGHDCLDTVIALEEKIKELRPATDEEKQRLFDAMAKRGKWWNAEKKVVEDIPKPHEFQKGDPVLARLAPEGKWYIAVYQGKSDNPGRTYLVTDGRLSLICTSCIIPYNDKTMHLLGTTEDYREE